MRVTLQDVLCFRQARRGTNGGGGTTVTGGGGGREGVAPSALTSPEKPIPSFYTPHPPDHTSVTLIDWGRAWPRE